jgi:DNA polymerase-4
MEQNQEPQTIRKIIHIDMDAFYASVEQLDNPELKGKAIAVGGSKERGVVAAASYEARKFGVHSAMPSKIAIARCPHLIFVSGRHDRYKEVSIQIMSIFKHYTNLIEPLSLDEAYLDVTYNKKNIRSAIRIAQLIRRDILTETGLTASAGVSFNKFLAKTASDLNKPDGLSVILPEEAVDFMRALKIEKFHGVGKVTAERMHDKGIFSGGDLMKMSRKELIQNFGKAGRHYHNIITANDQRPVVNNRIRKSVGAERTFSEDIESTEEFLEKLNMVHQKLMERIKKVGRKGRTITLKIKYHDFEIRSRSKSLDFYTQDEKLIWETAVELLQKPEWPNRGVRLLGLSISQLDIKEKPKNGQLTLDF